MTGRPCRRPRGELAGLTLLCALLITTAGCGDDDGGTDAGPPALDQCTNPADLALIETLAAELDGGTPDGGVPDGGPYPLSYIGAVGLAFNACNEGPCLTNILSEEGIEACVEDCLGTSPASMISQGCRDCTFEVTRCAAANCVTECLGMDQSLCDACAQMFCVPRYSACTGLPAPTGGP